MSDDHVVAECLLAERAERRRIAEQLHDGPVQLLTAAQLRLQHALELGRLDGEVGARVADEIGAAARELRALLAELQPVDRPKSDF